MIIHIFDVHTFSETRMILIILISRNHIGFFKSIYIIEHRCK